MFTGIVTEIGNILAIEDMGDRRVTISCAMDPAKIAIGASIACSGVCLTVVDKGGVAGEGWFAVDVSGETVKRTAPERWTVGAPLNLEPALRLGDELGGHIVTGHVDAVGEVVSVKQVGASWQYVVSAPRELAPYIAAKGSITVDGVSLTVNEVAGGRFAVITLGACGLVLLRGLTGLLNSRLLTWFFRAIQPRVGKVFAELKINQLHQFPLPSADQFEAVNRRLGPGVDKMLALVPKLRAARSESERATLQNAVTATDQQMDALVYELYGLTPEEIQLVEGGA